MSVFNSFVPIITALAFVSIIHFINKQALMMNKEGEAKDFKQMGIDDKDLVMFTITDLKLEKNKEQVHMVISLKRKIQTEMLTTYLPTLLLLIITYATTFFKPEYFEASVTVNLTIMLVMTTIFTSKIEELPPTSDTKMIDIWLIFCLLVPFAFTVIQTAIECYRDDTTDYKRPEAWTHWTGPVEDIIIVVCVYLSPIEMPKCRMIEFQKLISPILQDNAEGSNQGGPDTQSKAAWQTNQGRRVSWVAKHNTLKALQWAGSYSHQCVL